LEVKLRRCYAYGLCSELYDNLRGIKLFKDGNVVWFLGRQVFRSKG